MAIRRFSPNRNLKEIHHITNDITSLFISKHNNWDVVRWRIKNLMSHVRKPVKCHAQKYEIKEHEIHTKHRTLQQTRVGVTTKEGSRKSLFTKATIQILENSSPFFRGRAQTKYNLTPPGYSFRSWSNWNPTLGRLIPYGHALNLIESWYEPSIWNV